MKVILFALFVGLLKVGWGESSQPSEGVDTTDTPPRKDAIESAVDWAKLQDRNGVMYLPNEETPFTGRTESFYENEQKLLEGNSKDGKEDGLWTYWYEDGQKWKETNYKDGKPDGFEIYYNKDGTQRGCSTYKDGKFMFAVSFMYKKDGTEMRRATFKDGERVED